MPSMTQPRRRLLVPTRRAPSRLTKPARVAALLAVVCVVLAPERSAAQPGTEPPNDAPRPGPVVYIQPLGAKLPEADVDAVRVALEAFYGYSVRLLPRAPLPPAAFTRARRRWRAEKLLDWLGPRRPADGERILGLTAADISTTKGRHADWGILGLATIDGATCVISSFRCRRGARDAVHARQRLAKVAVHEIGHNLGLEHCPTVGCLMEDARGKVATCDREHDLCLRCRAQLRARGVAPTTKPLIPWPRPQ